MSSVEFLSSYRTLPEPLYSDCTPQEFASPKCVAFNTPLSNYLQLQSLLSTDQDKAEVLSGNRIPPSAQPLAQSYAGHQYGNFTNLGDGRALLLGELLATDGKLFDLQLKGSGRTPYSRRGDGLAALGPMLREFLISEAMYALGVPTTRSLAVVTTGEEVMRDGVKQGAVLSRVAASHIRVGTFEFAAALNDTEIIKKLTDYTIERHYPEIQSKDTKYADFLNASLKRQAELVSKWMLFGFVHGVLNTDNVAISGETIDYGPCAFIDQYDPEKTFSSIDRDGRYSLGNQASIVQWNMARFAETLIPLLDTENRNGIDVANQALRNFIQYFQEAFFSAMRRKIGLAQEHEGDQKLIQNLLEIMQREKMDYTGTFLELERSLAVENLVSASALDSWMIGWRGRTHIKSMSA